jgi:hypothetical protein
MTRRVGPVAPIQWFINAINVGTGHAKPLFGGTFVLLVSAMAALMVVGIVIGMFLDGGNTDPSLDPAKMAQAMLPVLVIAAMVPAFVIAGIAMLVHNAHRNAPTRVSDAFAGLRGGRALHLALLVLVPLASLGLNSLITDALAGPGYREAYGAAIAEMMNTGNIGTMPQPERPLAMFFASLVLNLLTYAVQVFAAIQVVVGGRTAWRAVADALLAIVRNPVPSFLAGVLAFTFLLAVVISGMLLMLLVALLTAALGTVGGLISLVLALGLATIAAVVWVAWGYFAWREMISDEGEPPAMPAGTPGQAPPDQFAA